VDEPRVIERPDYLNRQGLAARRRMRGRGNAVWRRMRRLGPWPEPAPADVLDELTEVTVRGRRQPGED
jgi:hypothetical protein